MLPNKTLRIRNIHRYLPIIPPHTDITSAIIDYRTLEAAYSTCSTRSFHSCVISTWCSVFSVHYIRHTIFARCSSLFRVLDLSVDRRCSTQSLVLFLAKPIHSFVTPRRPRHECHPSLSGLPASANCQVNVFVAFHAMYGCIFALHPNISLSKYTGVLHVLLFSANRSAISDWFGKHWASVIDWSGIHL